MNKSATQARSKQLGFSGKAFSKPNDCFGGSLLKSHPKVKRPLSTKFPLHLVLRANQGGMRLPKTHGKIHKLLYKTAEKYGIKIYRYANVGNHLHLLIKLTRLKLWAAFIRELSSQIAQVVRERSGSTSKRIDERISEKTIGDATGDDNRNIIGNSTSLSTKDTQKKFWKHRPYTRIIRGWRKAFQTAKEYIALNQAEAEGHIHRKDIKTLKDLRALFADG